MHRSARLTGGAFVVAEGLGLMAPAANAVVDPAHVGNCLTSRAGELTTVIDPSAPRLPVEISILHCVTGP
ncbi:hypothetical protein GCM10022224_053470 [Nonomuraea antimicrobica]|uniref:Uncharacterized protein n=1 Tax=Nonomuraea antimicrobica TaxID=561173 RepID=A0ABP7CA85_9ACTN